MESVEKLAPKNPLLKNKVACFVFWKRDRNFSDGTIFLPNNICGLGFTLSGKLLVQKGDEMTQMPSFGTRNTLNKPSKIITEGDFFNVSVRLVIPNGLSLFTKIPMFEVYQEEGFPLEYMYNSSELALVSEQLSEAQSNEKKAEILENFLVSKMMQSVPKIFAYLVDTIHQSKGFTTVHQLAHKFEVSERSIHRYFNKYVGVGANEYINLIRFRSVIDAPLNSSKEILRQALEVGYYDQSHFIKHFKVFSTLTPSEFFGKNSNQLSDFYNI